MGFSLRKFKRFFSNVGRAIANTATSAVNTVGDGLDDFARGVRNAGMVVGRAVASAADVVGDGVVTYGKEAGRFSVHATGKVVDWSQTTATEVADWSESAAGDVADFSEDSFNVVKDAAVSAYGQLMSLLASHLPELGPFDDRAELIARFVFPAHAPAYEEWAKAKSVTIALQLEGNLSAVIGISDSFGVYVSQKPDGSVGWGFFGLSLEQLSRIQLTLNPSAGFSLLLKHIIFFGSRDRFSGAAYLPVGGEINVKVLIAGAKLMLKPDTFRLLGFQFYGGFGITKGPNGSEFIPSAELGSVTPTQLLNQSRIVAPSIDAALTTIKTPGAVKRIRTTAVAASLRPFKPLFRGRLRPFALSDKVLVAQAGGLAVLTTSSTGDEVTFRLVAGLSNADMSSFELYQADGTAPRYLRVQNGVLELARYEDTAAFKESATFELERGLGDPGGISMKTVQAPPRYIAYTDLVAGTRMPSFQLYATTGDGETWKAQATWLLDGLLTLPSNQETVLPSAPVPGEYRRAPNGRFLVVYQPDGSLRLLTGTAPHDLRPAPSSIEVAGNWSGPLPAPAELYGDPGPTFTVVTDEGHLAMFRGAPSKPGELVWSSKYGAVHWAVERKPVHLSFVPGKFLSAEGGGKAFVRWDVLPVGGYETFELCTLWNGRVALRADAGLHLSARWGQYTPTGLEYSSVFVDQPVITDCESFELIPADGTDRYYFRTRSGRFLRKDPGGRVTCDGQAADELCKLSIIRLTENLSTMSGRTYTLRAKHSGQLVTARTDRFAWGPNVAMGPDRGGLDQTITLNYMGGADYALEIEFSGQVLDVEGASTAEGAPLQTYPWTGVNDNQRFRIWPTGDGTYHIGAKHSGKFLEVAGGSTTEGAALVQTAWAGRPSQCFYLDRAVRGGRSKPQSQWSTLGRPIAGGAATLAQNVAALCLRDGRLAVFMTGSDGAVWTRRQEAPGGTWGSWSSLSGTVFQPRAMLGRDGRITVVGIGNDTRVWSISETTPGGAWGDWQFTDGWAKDIEGFTHLDGRIGLVVTGTDNGLHQLSQQSPGGAWGPWLHHGGVITGRPCVAFGDAGHMHIFVRGNNLDLWCRWESAPNVQPNTWTGFGGWLASDPSSAINFDGRLECLGIGGSNTMYTTAQTVRNGSWTGYIQLVTNLVEVAAAAGVDTTLTLACRDAQNQLVMKRLSTAGWQAQTAHGGDLRGRPIPVATPDGIAILAMGGDGDLKLYW